ncbi:unnamed protein product [Caretta caretta]
MALLLPLMLESEESSKTDLQKRNYCSLRSRSFCSVNKRQRCIAAVMKVFTTSKATCRKSQRNSSCQLTYPCF